MNTVNFKLVLPILLIVLSTSLAGGADQAEKLSLKQRVWIAAQIYSFVHTYFGHWRAVPDIDFDKEYQNYLDHIIAKEDRLEFDLATIELIAKLKNSHSGFSDRWLQSTHGQALNFYAYPIQRKWVVTQSNLPQLKIGDVIAQIDGQSFDDFFENRRKYLGASDDRWARRSFFEYAFLFPKSCRLKLEDGRSVSVTRKGESRQPGSEHAGTTVREEKGFGYVKIPSFARPKFESEAIKAVKTMSNAKAIVLDLRGNHGGSTPEKLLEALMERPYRWWAESTPLNIGLFKQNGFLGKHADLHWYGDVNQPGAHPYRGRLYILVDSGCFSAAEDFVMPFKDNHRATIIGEKTGGSSGQPAWKDLGNGMGISIGTKREYFPDGSEFEGVGIAPDIPVSLTADDLRKGADPILAKATELVAQGYSTAQPKASVGLPKLKFTSTPTGRKLTLRRAVSDGAYLKKMRSEYQFEQLIAEAKSDFDRVQAVAHWARSRWEHNGDNEPRKADPISILEEAKQGKSFRCVEYSIVLSAALNALDIPARVTGLMTSEVETAPSGAGHVITEAFLRDQKKWVMVDGQWDVIPMLGKTPLNAVELQDALAQGKPNLTVYSLTGTKATDYFPWIGPYLYYFDTRISATTEDSYSRHSDALVLVPIGAKEPKTFQRRINLERNSYTHSQADFYPNPD